MSFSTLPGFNDGSVDHPADELIDRSAQPPATLRQSAVPVAPAEPGKRPWWRRPIVFALATGCVMGMGGLAYFAKGKGYLFQIQVALGLRNPPNIVQPVAALPDWSDAEFDYGAAHPDFHFRQVPLPVTADTGWTCVEMGPDGALWAGSDDGRFFRFPLSEDGTVGQPTIYDGLQKHEGGPRLVTGFCFDPSAPAESPVIYASSNHFAFFDSPDWSGKIVRLSGPDLSKVEDVVIGLPRSTGDHATNQPNFGPDGALYFSQPSNTAFGAPDSTWGMRPERLLNATILRLDLNKIDRLPLNVQTRDGGGSYDPAAPDAPLTIYAYGVRLAYDLCWARDGRLYAPVNGSSPGGNTPEDPHGRAPQLTRIPTSEHDWLLRINPGAYYGHPNPQHGYYILNGANPTADVDFAEVKEYPVGTLPEPDYDLPIADLGDHRSANGVIHYQAVGDLPTERLLDECLVIANYSFGQNLSAIRLDDEGNVLERIEAIPGFTGFANPLDVTQDLSSGYLYVADYGARSIILLRPAPPLHAHTVTSAH